MSNFPRSEMKEGSLMKQYEYIWLDGTEGDPQLRSKTRFLESDGEEMPPYWSFDGGSTFQGNVTDSDRVLVPVATYSDPFNEEGVLVFCEVFYPDMTPHESNSRQLILKSSLESNPETWFGFEQEYTLMTPDHTIPLAWKSDKSTMKQEYSYCGVGAKYVTGRGFAYDHAKLCSMAGISIAGINAEVMPGQWEYQTMPMEAHKAADGLWISRYLLFRLAEIREVGISLDPKPKSGYNGAGLHTNFSTKETRNPETGMRAINSIITNLRESHPEAVSIYGKGIERRLTGLFETSHMEKFTSGVSDRSASVRIPAHVDSQKCGYLEDRRPCANADPYLVCQHLLNIIETTLPTV